MLISLRLVNDIIVILFLYATFKIVGNITICFQGSKQLVVEEPSENDKSENLKLEGATTELMIEPQNDFETQLTTDASTSILDEKVIIAASTDFVSSSGISDVVLPESSNLATSHSLFAGVYLYVHLYCTFH